MSIGYIIIHLVWLKFVQESHVLVVVSGLVVERKPMDASRNAYTCISIKNVQKCRKRLGIQPTLNTYSSNRSTILKLGDAQSQNASFRCVPSVHKILRRRRMQPMMSFRCDACGTTRRGSFYLCVVCQYGIHQR